MIGDLNPSNIIVLLIVAAVLFFGASKIPELFRNMGRAVGEFKKGRIEAEMELNQMQQTTQVTQQPQVIPSSASSQSHVSPEELEKQIKDLQSKLEQLKKNGSTS
ncbi:MAG: twin-arginine translocase TatA/TatE family subunit [Candidatus Aramenus sp.]|jgi:sec-independent protein translocase protein TatA|nr:twin-arginine translocase TatA/TatE family subunit [Candidatus Aramenus sp.]